MLRSLALVLVLIILPSCHSKSRATQSEDKTMIKLKINITGDMSFTAVPDDEVKVDAGGYKDNTLLEQDESTKGATLTAEFIGTRQFDSSYVEYAHYSYMNISVPYGSTSYRINSANILGSECTFEPSEGPITYNMDGTVAEMLKQSETVVKCSNEHAYPIRGVVKGNSQALTIKLAGTSYSDTTKTFPAATGEESSSFDYEQLKWNWSNLVAQTNSFNDADKANANLQNILLSMPPARESKGANSYKSLRATLEIVEQGEGDVCVIKNGPDLIAGQHNDAGHDCSQPDRPCLTQPFHYQWTTRYREVEISCSPRPIYKISGNVTGQSSDFTLNVGTKTINIGAGDTSFETTVYGNKDYALAIASNPTNQVCTLSNSGIENLSGDVTNLTITCSTSSFSLGGTVSGLGAGSVAISVNSGQNLTLSANGSFSFPNTLANGTAYAVTITTQPSAYHCDLSNGTGTIASTVSNLSISCSAKKLIYLTSPVAANFGGIAGADGLCDTNKPSAGSWKALISDGTNRLACSSSTDCTNDTTGRVDWTLAANTSYRRAADDTLIAVTNANGIFDFPLNNGWASNSNRSWTGLQATWAANTANNCLAWTSASAANNGKAGINDATNSTSIAAAGTQTCDSSNTLSIICVQQ